VDDFRISKIEHLPRECHQSVKHPEDTLMKGWEVAVLQDADKGQFRMWSRGNYLTSTNTGLFSKGAEDYGD
jgi:hypothetical protein